LQGLPDLETFFHHSDAFDGFYLQSDVNPFSAAGASLTTLGLQRWI
jgi:hypothetical protein